MDEVGTSIGICIVAGQLTFPHIHSVYVRKCRQSEAIQLSLDGAASPQTSQKGALPINLDGGSNPRLVRHPLILVTDNF